MPKNQIIYILKFNQETIRNAFDVLFDCIFSSFITWLAFKRSVWDGVSNFLVNSAITETQIWTQPTRTLKDYQNYCRKYKSGSNSFVYQPQPEYYLRTYPGGASFTIDF